MTYVHWSDGGETSLDNTMLLSSTHQRLVHEGGYEIRKAYQGWWTRTDPIGVREVAITYEHAIAVLIPFG